MTTSDSTRKTSSVILLFGIIQWMLVIIIAEGIQPDYISSIHYVSTLGTGITAIFYNSSTILLGASVTIASILIRRLNSSRFFSSCF